MKAEKCEHLPQKSGIYLLSKMTGWSISFTRFHTDLVQRTLKLIPYLTNMLLTHLHPNPWHLSFVLESKLLKMSNVLSQRQSNQFFQYIYLNIYTTVDWFTAKFIKYIKNMSVMYDWQNNNGDKYSCKQQLRSQALQRQNEEISMALVWYMVSMVHAKIRNGRPIHSKNTTFYIIILYCTQ